MTRRLRRGLLTAALLVAGAAAAAAHEPGLSVLDVRLGRSHIGVELRLAAPDADAVQAPAIFAGEAIALHIDGRELHGSLDAVAHDSGGSVRVRVIYERAAGARLVVRSDVPRRIARGHRQLLSIRAEDGTLLLERMLDGDAVDEVLDLRAAGGAATASGFFVLGIEHILGGWDHLLFLAALLIAVPGRRELIGTVTAFTVAHSLTLAAAVVGLVEVPAAVVEPLIAASIVYVAFDNLLGPPVSARWKLTFGFGLIHGFGFAAALRDLGVGSGAAGVAVPLASFNLGVEAGQIAVAALLLPVISRLSARPVVGGRLRPVVSALVLLAGGYWLVERLLIAVHG